MESPTVRPGGATFRPRRGGFPWLLPAGLALLGTCAISLAGALYLRDRRADAQAQVQTFLTGVAALGVRQVEAWRQERLGDAGFFAEASFLVGDLARYLNTGRDVPQWIGVIAPGERYVRVFLLDAGGALSLSHPALPGGVLPPSLAAELAGAAQPVEGPWITDLLQEANGDLRIHSVIPLRRGGRGVGTLILSMDPAASLSGLLGSRTVATATAETILVRLQGGEPQFLHAGREWSRLTLSLPLAAVSSSPPQSFRGEGPDDRGRQVLFAGFPVPGTPWHVVARIGAAEAYAELRHDESLLAATVLALLAATWGGLWLVWSRREAAYLADALRLAEEIAAQERDRAQLVQVHRLLHAVNRAAQQAGDPEGFFTAVCRCIVEECALPLVWIGKADAARGRVIPQHVAGHEDGYLGEAQVELGDTPRGRGPTGRAIREGIPVTCADIALAPEFAPWRDAALARGYRSAAAVPLRRGGDVVGALMLYAAEPAFFSERVLQFLEEVGTVMDATVDALDAAQAQRAAEEALRRSEQMLSQAEQIARLGSYEYDLRTRRLRWSAGLPRVFGMDPSQRRRLPSSLYAAVHPEDRRHLRQAVRRALTERRQTVFEHRVIRADGTVRIIEGRFEPVFDADGRHVCNSGTAQDITELRGAEQAARQVAQEWQTTFDAAQEAIMIIDGQWRIVRANLAAADLFGVGCQEAIGQRCYELLHRSAEPIRDCPHALMLWTGERAAADQRYGDRWFRVSVAPAFDEAGRMIHAVHVMVDITERKVAEELIRRLNADLLIRVDELAEMNRALQESNRDLEQFAYVASHDLQEPLRMVGSFVQLLERRHAERLGTEGREFISYAVEGVERMQRMILDLLEYSRITSRGREVGFCSLERALAEAAAALEVTVRERGAQITHDALPSVRADASQMTLLFQNLVSNALKFRTAAPPRVHVSARPEGGRWEITVRDNGIGIDARYQERIFLIFQRLHSREEYPGTGIGLALCKRIVERHGGRIRVSSRLGEGAAFTFTLPREEERP